MGEQAYGARTSSESVKGFLVLSRLPFLLPGLAALVTGVWLGLAANPDAEPGLVAMAVSGIALIMLATYYFNEYFDFEGDLLNRKFTKFSGGSRALPDNMVPRTVAKIAGRVTVAILAAYAAIYMLFYFHDYPLLLPLALLGAFCGIFYSHTPFQWSYRGIGEILIGGCYGVLAVVSGYYVSAGELPFKMVAIAIPASLSIFAVIVCNEIPDYEADVAVRKMNLVARMGPGKGAIMYAAAMALLYPFMLASILVGVPWTIAVVGLPVLLLSTMAVVSTLKGGFLKPETQQKLSAITLVANLLSALLFIPAILIW